MKLIATPLDGLKILELDFHRDSRGFFVERFNSRQFAELGLPVDFVQDNHSQSAPGVLRGLHYQADQGKLISVIRGAIWDVAVDIRPDSATFGQKFEIELAEGGNRVVWIPAGFAHGFYVLGNSPVDVFYKTTALYNPKTEGGIRWNDPDLKIQWPHPNPSVSDRDSRLPSFKDYRALRSGALR